MDNLCDCFKIAAVIMLFCFAALHLPDFKRKMLPQNFIEPIHKISHYFTEQIVLILKEKYSAPVVTPAFWQIPRRDAPANPFSINSFLAHWIRCIFVSLSCIFFPAMVRSL